MIKTTANVMSTAYSIARTVHQWRRDEFMMFLARSFKAIENESLSLDRVRFQSS